MKEHWITLGFNAGEIRTIKDFVNYKSGKILPYIRDIHFPHYDAKLLSSGRASRNFSKRQTKNFLKVRGASGIYRNLERICVAYEYLTRGLEKDYRSYVENDNW